jgi:hypothetical protein
MPADAAWAELIAAAALHGTAFQGPATNFYLELCSDTPTATVDGTPVAYTGYAGRVAMPHTHWTGDGAGNRVSNADVEFGTPSAGDSDTATFVEFWSASSGGSRLAYEELDSPVTIDPDMPSVVFPSGQLHFNVA